MGTRSGISIINLDDSIESIYCHYDGYLLGVGATLLKSYSTIASVRALIALGGISYLSETISETSGRAYTTRGEELEIRKYPCLHAMPVINWEESDQEYQYFFQESTGKWLYAAYPKKRLNLQSLTDLEVYLANKYGSLIYQLKHQVKSMRQVVKQLNVQIEEIENDIIKLDKSFQESNNE